eukprot:c17588_g1_i2.p1 GENE.c17588_g1_i2~~c17588_g1_i2.p1  ORF type:complete len:165 (+),score=27.28 c17588_g1_i2:181-675(+)
MHYSPSKKGLAPHKISPTVGLNIGKLEIESRKLTVWDLGGQESLRSIWEKYFAEAHGIIFVFDAATPERFAECKQTLEYVLCHSDLVGAPLLVLANKQDVPSARRSLDELQSLFNLRDISGRPVKILLVSGLNGDGVLEGLVWIANTISLAHSRRAFVHQLSRD